MSICSSGASTTKPGVPAAVVVDQAYVQSLLPTGLAWLYPYLPFMHGLQIGDVGAFCASDPPSFTVPTAVQIFALITGGELSQAAAVSEFMTNVTLAYLWSGLCECTSGSTPGPPSAPSAPTGLPAINPPAYVGPGTAGPCAHYQASHPFSDGATAGDDISMVGTVNTNHTVITPVGIPAGATSCVVTCSVSRAGAVHALVGFFANYVNAAGSLITGGDSHEIDTGGPDTFTFTLAIPSTATGFVAWEAQDAAGAVNTDTGNLDVQFFCGGAGPNSTASPCCPPDPIATGLLAQILQTATLIQRQIAPFAYVAGAVHAGLSGDGSFAVAGILGLRIDITTAPTRLGEVGGEPVTLWDAGWVNVGTADGYGPRYFISSNPFLLRPISGDITVVGYSVPADVTVSITELVREP